MLVLGQFPALALQSADAGTQSALNDAIAQLQKDPADKVLREKIIGLVLQMNPPPAVPEAANRHLVRALAFVKEAQSDVNPASDFDAAISELRQALLAAPWWGIAYYNLAIVEEQQGQFDDATSDLKLYLFTRPRDQDAKQAQDKIYAIEVEKEIATKRNAEAQAAAESKKEDADWLQLKAALDEQDKQSALAGPWVRTGGVCSAANASVANGAVSGSITYIINTSGSTILGTSSSSMNLAAGFGGTVNNGAIDGQVSFGSYKIGYGNACQVAAAAQGLSGSIGPDGRSMELDTTVTSYSAQTQGLIITTCTSVSPASQQTARCYLASQAPHLVPLSQVVDGLPPGSPDIDQAEAVRLVLSHGADVNQANTNGTTALHEAAYKGNRQLVEILLDNGAQIDLGDKNNTTALTFATLSGSLDTVKLLLARGARPDLVNNWGMSPLYYAVGASSASSQPPALPAAIFGRGLAREKLQ